MRPRLGLSVVVVMVIGSVLLGAASVTATPPPPPGGHIPIHFGGANQGGYPPLSEAVADPELGAAPSLHEVSSAPNPFQGATTIRFTLAQGMDARLRIFDLTGRQVRELMHRATEAGAQEMQWEGRDQEGNPLGSGVYFYQVAAGERSVTRKLVLLH